jgi:uncharacterized protein HemX
MTAELDAGDPKVIDGEVVEAKVVGPPDGGSAPPPPPAPDRSGGGGSRGPVSVRAVALVVLLLATTIFGTLFARERSAREEDRRHMRAQSTRLAQRSAALAAELAVVRTQRDRLARVTESQALSPAAVAAVRACVQHYADVERALTTPGAVPPIGGGAACINAEPYVR